MTFDQAIDKEDLDVWINAIKMMRNVVDVRPAPSMDLITETAIRIQERKIIRDRLRDWYEQLKT